MTKSSRERADTRYQRLGRYSSSAHPGGGGRARSHTRLLPAPDDGVNQGVRPRPHHQRPRMFGEEKIGWQLVQLKMDRKAADPDDSVQRRRYELKEMEGHLMAKGIGCSTSPSTWTNCLTWWQAS